MRYGRSGQTYGWQDPPSFSALAQLYSEKRNRSASWHALITLVKLNPALLNCRDPKTGRTFLHYAIVNDHSRELDSHMVNCLLSSDPSSKVDRAPTVGFARSGLDRCSPIHQLWRLARRLHFASLALVSLVPTREKPREGPSQKHSVGFEIS